MKSRMGAVVMLSLSAGWLAVASAQAPPAAVFKQENTPGNLQALLQRMYQHFYVDKSPKDGLALFRSLVPDERRTRRALKDDLAPEALQRVLAFHKSLTDAGDPDPQRLVRPGQTVVRVWGATTEEIRKYQEGSIAFKQFPGGAKQVAERILRPGMTFYQAEFLEPGADAGILYHLFYWDNQQWSMLGPVWRALQ